MNQHDGDCTIYAKLVGHNLLEGICTCGYGRQLVRNGDESQIFSEERKEREECRKRLKIHDTEHCLDVEDDLDWQKHKRKELINKTNIDLVKSYKINQELNNQISALTQVYLEGQKIKEKRIHELEISIEEILKEYYDDENLKNHFFKVLPPKEKDNE